MSECGDLANRKDDDNSPCAPEMVQQPRRRRSYRHPFMLAALLVIFTSGCTRELSAAEPEPVVIAVSMQPMAAPIFVADSEGYFRAHGLNVELMGRSSGREALADVLNGTADFGMVTETPIVLAGIAGEPVSIVAEIADSSAHVFIVARVEAGIQQPRDISGKAIGVMFGTNAEYFLHEYCIFNNISLDAIRTIDLRPEEMKNALLAGDVDAVVVWNPHADVLAQTLGREAVVLKNPYVYTAFCNIVVRNDNAANKREAASKFLGALIESERFIRNHPERASAIVSERLGGLPFSFDNYGFDVSLSQVLILAMEDQARWAMTAKGIGHRTINFRKMLYTDALEAVAPDSITLISP